MASASKNQKWSICKQTTRQHEGEGELWEGECWIAVSEWLALLLNKIS